MMFLMLIAAMTSPNWEVYLGKDMLTERATATAILTQEGAVVGLVCNADTEYKIAVLVGRADRSNLPSFGSSYVEYEFDDGYQRSAHWLNNSRSLKVNNQNEARSFLNNISKSSELKFRARTNEQTSIDMQFPLSGNRQNLSKFFDVCPMPK
jgi:hypothetical protein